MQPAVTIHSENHCCICDTNLKLMTNAICESNNRVVTTFTKEMNEEMRSKYKLEIRQLF